MYLSGADCSSVPNLQALKEGEKKKHPAKRQADLSFLARKRRKDIQTCKGSRVRKGGLSWKEKRNTHSHAMKSRHSQFRSIYVQCALDLTHPLPLQHAATRRMHLPCSEKRAHKHKLFCSGEGPVVNLTPGATGRFTRQKNLCDTVLLRAQKK